MHVFFIVWGQQMPRPTFLELFFIVFDENAAFEVKNGNLNKMKKLNLMHSTSYRSEIQFILLHVIF